MRFEPWETLLLLEDARQLQRDVLEGSLLWRFLEICRPTLSFGEYETLLDLDSEDQMLEDVVDHLVHWKKAKVIDLISLKNSYAVTTDFETKQCVLFSLPLSFPDSSLLFVSSQTTSPFRPLHHLFPDSSPTPRPPRLPHPLRALLDPHPPLPTSPLPQRPHLPPPPLHNPAPTNVRPNRRE